MLSDKKNYADMRLNSPIGVNAIYGPELTTPLPILSLWLFIEAVSLTEKLLDDFEKKEFYGINTKLLYCTGLWFMAMESAISTVYKLLSTTQGCPVYRTLPEKFCNIPKFVNSEIIPTSQQTSELQEFCCFRNSTFHDLYHEGKNTKYSHTLFTTIPAHANEIDLMESARIAINCTNFYRYAISGYSLIAHNYDLIDIYNTKLLPRFHSIMEEKQYQSVYFRSFDPLILSPITNHEYKGVIKAK